jgi:transposase
MPRYYSIWQPRGWRAAPGRPPRRTQNLLWTAGMVGYTHGMETREPYPSDVGDEEWAFVAPYLTLLPLDAERRKHDLREACNALRYLVRSGEPWRMSPIDLPPWYTVYQQTQRWLAGGSFESIVHDLRVLLRLAQGRNAEPSADIFLFASLLWCYNVPATAA